MRFFRNKTTALAAQEDRDEYVVEVQDNNVAYLRSSEKLNGALEDNPTFDSEANADALAVQDHDDQVDPFGIEMDVQTYNRQTRADIPEKPPQEEKFTVSPRSIRALFICALLVIALIISLFIALSVTRGKSSAAATTTAAPPTAPPPTASPPTSTNELTADEASAYIMKSLNFTTPQEIATASNGGTPQGQAVSSLAVGEQLASTRTSPSRIQQRYALSVLYYSTSGSSSQWIDAEGWSTVSSEECQWKGITCGGGNTTSTRDESVAVTDLNLSFNNLVGTIPTELCTLSDSLVHLDLSGNHLDGAIPECFPSLTKLQTLQLFNNSLTGTLPPFGLASLSELDLRYNQMTGTLDGMFDATTSLVLDQETPPALSILRLDRNKFTGMIPSMPGAEMLTKLTLSGNELTGDVPFCNDTDYPLLDTVEVDCLEVNCTCCYNCDIVWCFTDNC